MTSFNRETGIIRVREFEPCPYFSKSVSASAGRKDDDDGMYSVFVRGKTFGLFVVAFREVLTVRACVRCITDLLYLQVIATNCLHFSV
jgi:hypothetical protein